MYMNCTSKTHSSGPHRQPRHLEQRPSNLKPPKNHHAVNTACLGKINPSKYEPKGILKNMLWLSRPWLAPGGQLRNNEDLGS